MKTLGRSDLSGRDQFSERFRTKLHEEAEWLEMGARHKADSVELLLKRNQIKASSIIELGAGTGAVISEIARRGIGTSHYAVDFSTDAIAYLRRRSPNIKAWAADVTILSDELKQLQFDLAVASHVVEHLEDPLAFLRSIRDLDFRFLLVEVPLENLPAGKIKGFRKNRKDNPAGHVQFFDARGVRALLKTADYELIDERRYAPVLSKDQIRAAYSILGGGS